MVGCHTRKFFKIDFLKNVIEKRLFWVLDNPLQKVKSVSLFVKTENFSFSVDKNLQKCRMTILMSQKHSPQSGEHFKCLQSIYEVSRKDLQAHFQESYFFQKSFFLYAFGLFLSEKKLFEKIRLLKMRLQIFCRHFIYTL